MAQLGVEAIAKFKASGEKPKVSPGLEFFDTGVALVTDQAVDGVESIDVAEAEKICWGK
jgi:fructose transport system substrate-binding protein